MKTYQKLGTVLALTLGSVAAANATVLYNNLPANVQAIDSGLGLAGDGFIANEFSTGSLCPSGCILGNITLNLTSQDGSTAGYQLRLLSDAAGTPGSTLATFNNPVGGFSTDFNNNVFTPIGTTSLAAQTNYWVELVSTNNNGALTYWDYKFNATQTVPNQPNLIAYHVGFEQGATTAVNLLMKVEGTAIGVPVAHTPLPGAAWMMGSALFGLVASRRRKPRSC